MPFGRWPSAPITLADNFDTWRRKTEMTQRFGAAYFCVPVSKNGRRIYKEREHLTVYQKHETPRSRGA